MDQEIQQAAHVMLTAGSLFTVLALPLVFRLVPMNPIYGARFCISFKSDLLWYEINAYAGRLLLILGLLCLGSGFVGLFYSPGWYGIMFLPLLIGGLIVVAVLAYLRARKLESEMGKAE